MHPLPERTQPEGWGVHTLEIDRAALAEGTLRVTRLECVLPDGTLVTHPHADDSGPLSLSLDERGFPQRIHVTRRTRVELVAAAPDAAPPEASRGCPLLQIERDEQGRPRLAVYHPPMLRLGAADFHGEMGLHHRLDALVERLWNRLQDLCHADEAPPEVELSGMAARHRAAAIALAAAVPPLGACVTDPATHPRAAYLALAGAAGALSALDGRPVPYRMQPYLHSDCIGCFADALRYLDARLDTVRSISERTRFSIVKGGFARRLPQDAGNALIVELRPQPGQTVADAGRWLASASIAASDMLSTVQRLRQRPSVRQVSEDEARRLGLPLDAALFWIRNDRIHSEGRDAFQPGETLLIQGEDRRGMPVQLFLLQFRNVMTTTQSIPSFAQTQDRP
ncbi:type VI secretion system baseplate subunit TssK [Massilia sp. CFBP9012]|uniref:type VI secretion system baseplate subunit TssK n=1 Tax=Massilia sp. CFBP9012 TaxID=3096531 RepID=UPI002A6A9DD7|nr:type VI secretion system baseplate subunit TssK [Massilia sp. CFBP9012]MDY0976103.1 type VI secretion system baseplate subunit TssK [Massilia sp. CFBP9012]